MSAAAGKAPAFILRLLDKLGIAAHAVADQPNHIPAQRVQAVLLEDANGMLLTLLGRDRLLDLEQICGLTSRAWQPLRRERLQRMLDKQQLDCLPGLPALTRAPCLYDQRLLLQPRLLVESGAPGVLLDITREAFASMLEHARPARFGVPLAAIPINQLPDQDQAQITRAVHYYSHRPNQQRLAATLELPALSATAEKLCKLRLDPDATIDDTHSVLESDAALATQLRHWSAASRYSVEEQARTVEDALVRVLGLDLGIHLALGLAVGKLLKLPDGQPLHTAAYQQQMRYAAGACWALSRSIPRAQRPESALASLCGQLHNIGYPLLAHAFPRRFALLCEHFDANPQVPQIYLEQHLLGLDREQFGSWLLRHWDMPEELTTAVRFQHDPDYAGPHAVYANLLCLALQQMAAQGIGQGPATELPQALFMRLGIDRQTAEQTMAMLLSESISMPPERGQPAQA